MKISALASLLGVAATTLLPGVSASESESSLRGAPEQKAVPELLGAIELGGKDNPAYCYPSNQWNTPQYNCYPKNGYPKCCTKEKGNCPNNHMPPCENQSQPNPPTYRPTDVQREFCRVGAGECANNQWCSTSNYGQCNGGQGQCTYFMGRGTCPSNHSPVCGCDGVTYSNECLATNAGVNVDYAGSCYNDRSCQVGKNNQCPNGQWCRAFSSSNDQCGGQGSCSYYLGGGCPSNYDPVCGCDGNTYDNECKATNAGVNVDYTGACSDCGISHNGQSECSGSQWCKALNGPGQCAVGSPGVCTYFTGNCNMNYDPVCGCDFKDYDNACQAATAGVNVQKSGTCANPQKVGSYCTAAPNLSCYQSGYPPCCHNGNSPEPLEIMGCGNNGDWKTKDGCTYPLLECTGDCDNDNDCAGDLVCHQRDEYEPVPGCSGGEQNDSKTDYCVRPSGGDNGNSCPKNYSDAQAMYPCDYENEFLGVAEIEGE